MNLLGLDLNATCALALHGPVGDAPLSLPLEPPDQALPMVLNLGGRSPQAGRVGLKRFRAQPHLTCHDFLATLGKKAADAPHWRFGRHLLDSAGAMTLVWQRLAPVCAQADGVFAVLPAYLSRGQAELVAELGTAARVRLLGSMSSLLAVALAGYAERAWQGTALVVDADDHALMLGVVRADQHEARIVEARHFPHLGVKVWNGRLVNALADRCVLQSRRDPRDVPSAEQGLFEQLGAVMDASLDDRVIQLGVQAPQWYQNLLVNPEETVSSCARLARQALQELDSYLPLLPADDAPVTLVMSRPAARLPGLSTLLAAHLMQRSQALQAAVPRPLTALEDFGETLMRTTCAMDASLFLLSHDALARSAHVLGGCFHRGELPQGHLQATAPLPLWTPANC